MRSIANYANYMLPMIAAASASGFIFAATLI